MHGQSEEVAKGVKQAVESARPRRHIEIEKKFCCTQKQMEQAEKYLDQEYHNAAEVWQFLLDTLDICDRGDLCKDISRDRLEVQLVVCNLRVTYRLEDCCEICLDTVDYKDAGGDPVGSQNYQIEIGLLGEPEAWAGLENDVTMPLIQTLGEDSLDYTNKSKLETGMDFLMGLGKCLALPDRKVAIK